MLLCLIYIFRIDLGTSRGCERRVLSFFSVVVWLQNSVSKKRTKYQYQFSHLLTVIQIAVDNHENCSWLTTLTEDSFGGDVGTLVSASRAWHGCSRVLPWSSLLSTSLGKNWLVVSLAFSAPSHAFGDSPYYTTFSAFVLKKKSGDEVPCAKSRDRGLQNQGGSRRYSTRLRNRGSACKSHRHREKGPEAMQSWALPTGRRICMSVQDSHIRKGQVHNPLVTEPDSTSCITLSSGKTKTNLKHVGWEDNQPDDEVGRLNSSLFYEASLWLYHNCRRLTNKNKHNLMYPPRLFPTNPAPWNTER